MTTAYPIACSQRPIRSCARLRGGGRDALLDTTALVHESYLRFLGSGQLRADDRRAFFAYASHVMRSVIIDACANVRPNAAVAAWWR